MKKLQQMLFFGKKKSAPSIDLSWLGTDMHSHLLPGIDDGVPDMDTSLSIIKGLAALGYKRLITTPHILWEMYPNTPEIIRYGIQQVQQAAADAAIDMSLHAAAEYFIDEHFVQELKNKEPLLTIKDNLVLVEFSMVTAPFDLHEVLFEMQLQNYQPVIAHPERYIYLRNKKSFFDELKEQGCFFQLNLLSLTGHYGASVQELAEYLVKKEYYNYGGSDIHTEKHLDALQKLSSSASFVRLKNSQQLLNYLL
jgi:tyrosine-protein phosphatase YwqE